MFPDSLVDCLDLLFLRLDLFPLLERVVALPWKYEVPERKEFVQGHFLPKRTDHGQFGIVLGIDTVGKSTG